jgi:hypothetical protein
MVIQHQLFLIKAKNSLFDHWNLINSAALAASQLKAKYEEVAAKIANRAIEVAISEYLQKQKRK